ncbi:MAG: DNA-processing protein DprA, partial [Mycobacterium sp.]
AGVQIHLRGDPAYPAILSHDQQAPPVLFSRGRLEVLDHPRVAIVGTRSATHYGKEVATELGSGLAQAGVVVVSGLALGIDGAAHEGALAALEEGGCPPAGVAGSGLDVVYPSGNRRLWRGVGRSGALLSEWPLGTRPDAWRFPARNRIIAALSQVVVVVESHRAGGALHTVEAAIERGIPVMAVPGSVRSPASEGTNALLSEGAAPVRDLDDVLTALDIATIGGPSRRAEPRATPDEGDGRVMSAVDWSPTSTTTILERTGIALGPLAASLGRLEEKGWLRAGEGWWERRGPTPAGGRT